LGYFKTGNDHLEDIVVDGKEVFKMDSKGIGWKVVDLIDVAQYRDQFRGFVNTVMDLRFL
jgi:hypothetical protein